MTKPRLENVGFEAWLRARTTVSPRGCWEWSLRSCDKDGYPRAWIEGGRQIRVHRAVYAHYKGDAGPLCVCHVCDNPKCLNPEHLWLGDNADNTRDRNQKGRQARGDRQGLRKHPSSVLRGETNGFAKLTADKVRALLREPFVTNHQRAMARKYECSQAHVGRILRREAWKHLHPEPPE